MTALRGRLRAIAFVWLTCQAASLAAFVPGECCKSHAAEAAAKSAAEACHEAAPVAPKEGDACPMHGETKSHDCCVISNACEGPGHQLTTLFAFVGVLEAPQSAVVPLDSIAAFIPQPPPLLHSLAIPDAPPPRA